ncbi:MAG: phosphate transport system regulatory protein PhoU [Candidatus Epulonipiscioides saccharophilum]|nr:MAG: phosphate transport system regulatory protein PhoU [Epulopiscium sp. AS2M-Bin001]
MTTRINFTNELNKLCDSMSAMGDEIKSLFEITLKVLIENDFSNIEEVLKGEERSDELEIQIQKNCVLLIAKEQPIARDLRLIISVINITTDMERIADQCEDICNYCLKIKDNPHTDDDAFKRHINKMAISTAQMLADTFDAYKNKDVKILQEVCEFDDKIDARFNQIWTEIIAMMSENEHFIAFGPPYIMIIKYLERIADHVTNIAEWMIYNITGEYV